MSNKNYDSTERFEQSRDSATNLSDAYGNALVNSLDTDSYSSLGDVNQYSNSVGTSYGFDATTGSAYDSSMSNNAAQNSAGSSSSFSMSTGYEASNCADGCGTCRSIQGVQCEATNCRYHHPGGQCSATNITVQAPDADCKTDTFCNTFTPNTGY